jgi:polyribonucleotide nucleotidyltransferase
MQQQEFITKIGGRKLTVKTGDIAPQANGSVLIQHGETMVLATACLNNQISNAGFFPLTVNYEEKYYASGEILGSRYMRREGRPSDEAILTSRLIDRAIRPRFPEGFKKEVQIIITVLSYDKENDPTIPALLGASLALSLSDIPWNGPLGIAKLKYLEEKWVINPPQSEENNSAPELMLTALEHESGFLINMIEGQAEEMPEEKIIDGLKQAQAVFQKIIAFQKEIIQKLAKPKIEMSLPPSSPETEEMKKELSPFLAQQNLKDYLFGFQGLAAKEKDKELKEKVIDWLEEKHPEQIKIGLEMLEEEKSSLIRQRIIEEGIRADGRKLDDIRPLSAQTNLSPRGHGSAIFSRGLTKIFSTVTLGPPEDQQKIEGMEIVKEKRFMHHYNFPPFATGETGRVGSPKRREIGHGHLAEKALSPLLPSFDDFPYTIRIVSETFSSNGSSSMASTCASSLALMDAGVPMKTSVAGIALGLITDGEKYKILTDIQGPEDHYGDMDFKVAGTENGVTAIQVDVKIKGVNYEIIEEALIKAKEARLKILKTMTDCLPLPRKELSPWAPKIIAMQISPDKIGLVIGPGGRMINELSEKHQVTIKIENSGKVYVSALDRKQAEAATNEIAKMTEEPEIGKIYQGKVRKILEFGAFVEFLPGQDGLVHISKFVSSRLNKVEDVVSLGDIIPVKLIEIDEQGRFDLSAKAAGFNPKK